MWPWRVLTTISTWWVCAPWFKYLLSWYFSSSIWRDWLNTIKSEFDLVMSNKLHNIIFYMITLSYKFIYYFLCCDVHIPLCYAFDRRNNISYVIASCNLIFYEVWKVFNTLTIKQKFLSWSSLKPDELKCLYSEILTITNWFV